MKRFVNLILVMGTLLPSVNAWAQSRDAKIAATVERFVANSGRLETLDGRVIDPARVDLSSLPAFVVRPGDSSHRVRIEQSQGAVRVIVMDENGRDVMGRAINAPSTPLVTLASAPSSDEGASTLAAIGATIIGLSCVAGLGTCPLLTVVVLAYMAIHEFERYDQLHHPELNKP